MKYVIVICNEEYSIDSTKIFVYETESQKELFKFIRAFNIEADHELEIEVWEYPKSIDTEIIIRLLSNNNGGATLYNLWQNELLGEQILGRHVDTTDKINVLSEDK